jgi:hypothetical protein
VTIWADELSAQPHKISCERLRLAAFFKLENVGSQFHSLRQRTNWLSFSKAGTPLVWASRGPVFGTTSGLRKAASAAVVFSVGPFFSGRLYYCAPVQSFGSSYFPGHLLPGKFEVLSLHRVVPTAFGLFATASEGAILPTASELSEKGARLVGRYQHRD